MTTWIPLRKKEDIKLLFKGYIEEFMWTDFTIYCGKCRKSYIWCPEYWGIWINPGNRSLRIYLNDKFTGHYKYIDCDSIMIKENFDWKIEKFEIGHKDLKNKIQYENNCNI